MTIKTMIGGLALACMATAASAQQVARTDINVETAITHEGVIRNRILGSAFADVGTVVAYSSINEIENGDGSTYFGRQTLNIGGEHLAAQAALRISGDDLKPMLFGLHNESLTAKLGGYGFIEVVANKNTLQSLLLYGKNFGKIDAYVMAMGTRDDGVNSAYNELQINTPLNANVNLFVRGEMSDYKPREGKAMVGIAAKF